VSTRDLVLAFTFVSDHLPPNVVGKTLMVPRFIGGSIRSFQLDGGVSVDYFAFVGAAHPCKWALGCTMRPGCVGLIIAGIPSVRDRRHAKVKPNSTLHSSSRHTGIQERHDGLLVEAHRLRRPSNGGGTLSTAG
jgi:hypothetical protein